MGDVRSGQDRREDDLEDDHQDHRHRSLAEERAEPEPDHEPDDSFELEPQPGLDHQRVGRVQETSGVVGIVHPRDETGRVPDLGLRGLLGRDHRSARSP